MNSPNPDSNHAKKPDPTSKARAEVNNLDDATAMAKTPHALTPQIIQELVRNHILVQVNKDSISQRALEGDPAFQQTDKSGNDFPIYVMPNTGNQKPTAALIDIGNGKKVIIANEGLHNWDADYVDRYIRQSDDAITENKEYSPAAQYKAEMEKEQAYQQLEKHIIGSGQKNGLGKLHILITSEPGVAIPYDRTSQKGFNYIIIPKQTLDKALTSPDLTRKLGLVIDDQIPDMKSRINLPQNMIAGHEGELYIASNTNKDNKLTLSTKEEDKPKWSQTGIDELVKGKILIPVKAEVDGVDITQLTDQDKKPLPSDTPVYVVAGANSDFRGNKTIIVAQTTGASHKPYVLIEESAHKIDVQYVKDHVLSTEVDIARAQVGGLLTTINPALGHKLLVPPGIQLLVNTDATVTSAYSFQSKEGKNYIVVPEKDAIAAAGQNGKVQDLQKAIDGQVKVIQNGNNSPEALLHNIEADKKAAIEANEKVAEADKWMAAHVKTDADGRLSLPDQHTEVDNATLDNLVKTGRFTETTPEKLVPGMDAAIAKAKDAAGNPLPAGTPVYLVTGTNNDSSDKASGQVMKTKEGKYYILLNEKAHKWTPENVSLPTDASINADISTEDHPRKLATPEETLPDVLNGRDEKETAAITRRYHELIATTEQYAKNMGMDQETILIDSSAQHTYASVGGASSQESKEGTKYIFLSHDKFAEAILSDEGLAVAKTIIGHETAHNAHKDSLPENELQAHDLSKAREHELRADLGGSGPLGTNDPLARVKVYEEALLIEYRDRTPVDQQRKLTDTDKLTDKEMEAVSQKMIDSNYDPIHPSRWEFIQALRYEDKLMKDFETNYQNTHGHAISAETPEQQHKIRAKEDAQVENQTVDFMKDKKQPRNEAPEIENAPSDNTHAAVKQAGLLLRNYAVTPHNDHNPELVGSGLASHPPKANDLLKKQPHIS